MMNLPPAAREHGPLRPVAAPSPGGSPEWGGVLAGGDWCRNPLPPRSRLPDTGSFRSLGHCLDIRSSSDLTSGGNLSKGHPNHQTSTRGQAMQRVVTRRPASLGVRPASGSRPVADTDYRASARSRITGCRPCPRLAPFPPLPPMPAAPATASAMLARRRAGQGTALTHEISLEVRNEEHRPQGRRGNRNTQHEGRAKARRTRRATSRPRPNGSSRSSTTSRPTRSSSPRSMGPPTRARSSASPTSSGVGRRARRSRRW